MAGASNSIENLNRLKEAYDGGLVSALIGAGFSKNIYEFYPTWPQLLKDIVKDLYPTEYNNLKESGNEDKSLKKLVDRIGPLEIVSIPNIKIYLMIVN